MIDVPVVRKQFMATLWRTELTWTRHDPLPHAKLYSWQILSVKCLAIPPQSLPLSLCVCVWVCVPKWMEEYLLVQEMKKTEIYKSKTNELPQEFESEGKINLPVLAPPNRSKILVMCDRSSVDSAKITYKQSVYFSYFPARCLDFECFQLFK